MKKIFLYTLFSLSNFFCFSQSVFLRSYGSILGSEDAWFLKQETSNSYIIIGNTNSQGAGANDVFFGKIDSMGFSTFFKTIGGTNSEVVYYASETFDNGYIINGGTNSWGVGSFDIMLVKTDSSGVAQWGKTYGTSQYEIGWSVKQTADSGFVVTGQTLDDLFIIRTDKNGDTLWTRKYGCAGSDYGYSVIETADGGFLAVGLTFCYGAGSSPDYLLLKTDASGSIQWTKAYTGNLIGLADVKEINNGNNYLIVGTYSGIPNTADINLIKTDTSGNVIWSKRYYSSLYDDPLNMDISSNGEIVISGRVGDNFTTGTWDGFLMMADSNGTLLWSEKYGMPNYDEELRYCKFSSGKILAAGYAPKVSESDGLLIKTDMIGGTGCTDFLPVFNSSGTSPIPVNTISIQDSATGFIITSFTPFQLLNAHADAESCYYYASGINELEQEGFSIYPNPSSGIFHIANSKMQNAKVEVFNVLGQSVGNWQLAVGKTTIDLSTRPAGLYFVRLATQDGKSFSQKIVKE